MKKILLLIVTLIMFASAATASPLTDYSLGRTAWDIGVNISPFYNSASPETSYCGIGYGFNAGATVGIGYHMALQYSIQNAASATVNAATGSYYLQIQQLNLLYNYASGDTPFFFGWIVGAQYGSAGLRGDSAGLSANSQFGGQIGLMLAFPLDNNVSVYGSARGGKPYSQASVGASYQFTPNLETNLDLTYITNNGSNGYPDSTGNTNSSALPISLSVTLKY